MSDGALLRFLSSVSVVFALVLSVDALTTGRAPGLPGYLTFLFVGLVGSFAARSMRALEKRVRELELRADR